MKRMILLTLILAVVLTACGSPLIMTSPSLSHQTTATSAQDNGLDHAADYAALIKLVRQAQSNTTGYQYRNYDMAAMSGAANESAVSKQAATADRTGSSDYSQTNIQVEGVDEADIIKTDGSYLYLVANNRLYVVDARNPAKMSILATVIFAASEEADKIVSGETPVDMYLDTEHNRLTLIVSGWVAEKAPANETATVPNTTTVAKTTTLPSTSEITKTTTGASTPAATGASAGAANGSSTAATTGSEPEKQTTMIETAGKQVTSDILILPNVNYKQYVSTKIYDIANKAAPKLTRQFTQEGYYVSSRKIDEAVYVVTNRYNYWVISDEETAPESIFPATRDDVAPVTNDGWNTVAADKISILPTGDVNNQTILSAINTLKDSSKPAVISMLGSSGIVYASTQYLYIAGYNYQLDSKASKDSKGGQTATYMTDIYRFKLAGAQISEAGKGSVAGMVINQFSMDEYDGFFRIATTSYTDGSQKEASVVKNNVYALDASLKTVGSVVGLAPGETIKSVRFMGSKVYVVTFRNVDPLFVIDMSKPADPVVLGQLKIPGYSTYLHPYDENKLLGFGYNVLNQGTNAYNLGLKVSLFDISDFNNPRELSTILLGDRGSYAEILNNHKTLLFSLAKNLIAFPATLTKSTTGNAIDYSQPVYQGLMVLAVDSNNQLTLRGQVTHFDKLNDPDGKPVTMTGIETQAFYGYDAINRGVWIGDILYTCSARQIRAARLDTLAPVGQVELPGYEDYNKVYYGNDLVASRGMLVD